MNHFVKTVVGTAAFLIAGAALPGASLPKASAAAEIDVTVFYGTLAPYGEWIQTQPYGWAWVPENVTYGWRPYTVGQWEWVEPYGWTWVSAEPWGWATDHYGRWTYVEDYGWAWVPGTTWAPAWVAFRYGDPWVGWAPLPPGPSWRFDAGFDVAGLNLDVSVGTYAWTFVSVRYFAEPDLQSRVLVTAYNPYLVRRTQWSTRYAAVDGGLSNRGVEVAVVEKARGAPVPRRRLQESAVLEQGAGSRVQGDAVVLFKPRIAPRASAAAPAPRVRTEIPGSAPLDLAAWTAQRQAALQAHLEAQKKALEALDGFSVPTAHPATGTSSDGDAASRREAALKAIEDERKRLESLLVRQRKRHELELQQAPPAPPHDPPPPPAMGDDGHGKKDDGHGKDDDGHGMK